MGMFTGVFDDDETQSVDSFQGAGGAEMPEAYSQNRMKGWGIGGLAQIGEALFDQFRANKWQKEQDEMAGRVPPIGGEQRQHPQDSGALMKILTGGFM